MNTRQKIQEQIKQLLDKKTQELLKIQLKLDEARAQLEAAELAIKEATEAMNLEAYEEAQGRKHKAQTAIQMYNDRYKQIAAREYISEEESDRVINSLLKYEEEIAAKFETDIAAPLKALKKLQEEYAQEVAATEAALKAWETDIHANYISGTASFFDPETGKRTRRSLTPVPVHLAPYTGSKASAIIRELMNEKMREYV